jgi:HlyD family type I secretion membrane fusion protein
MDGYQKLYDQGYAPKPLILGQQRSLADLAGRKGSLLADMARLKQQMGETRMQLASLRDQRASQAAEEVRDSQSKLADTLPRLTTAKQMLDETVIRSPVDGYVFNLTQFTVGGVTAPGEALLQVVPSHDPLIVSVMIKPTDIQDVKVGMDARVRFVGLNPRWNSPLPAKVVLKSADRISNDKTGVEFYRVDLRVDAKDVARLQKGGQITPGMPAQAMIVTGKRTLMGFLVTPITDTWRHAFHEQ